MKSLRNIFIALALVGLSAGVLNAQTSGSCGDNLTWQLTGTGSSLTLTISGTGAMTNYSDVNVPWYSQRANITTLALPNGMTTIGNDAFCFCSVLSSVTIPNSVTSIGNSAFAYCSGLTSVTIPNSVTSIGNSAFSGCSGLTGNLTIPNSVTSIGNSAFALCHVLTSVTIGNSVTSIENSAFYGCSGLTSITTYRTTPPTLVGSTFVYIPNSIPVFIPYGTSYSTTSGWNYFSNFRPIAIIPTTLTSTNITRTTATLNGTTTTFESGATATEQGFLLRAQGSSSVDTILVNTDNSTLTANVTNLSRGTTYYVKAFCTVSNRTFYGDELPFSTIAFDKDGANNNKIESKDDLLLLAKLVGEDNWFAGEKFILMNDIILPTTSNNIKSIGSYPNRPFCGEFDGNNNKIFNVYIDEPNTPYQGFFGYTKDAKIYNFGLVNITASGRNYTGGMIGYAENSRITDCYVNGGRLFALSYCGGLIGYQTQGTNSVITSCYNTCTVTGNNYVGGLLGYSNQGTVRNSYAAALVTGSGDAVGAIIGGALDVLSYNCYFNDSITGQSNAIGENIISGKGGDSKDGDESMSSNEMRMQAFVNTLNMGLVVPAWKMDYNPPINNGFPILIWQTNQTSSIEEQKANFDILIYPNPTQDKLTIESGDLQINRVEICDLAGRAVFGQPQGSPLQINVSALPAGIYLIKIHTEKGIVTRKVVKN